MDCLFQLRTKPFHIRLGFFLVLITFGALDSMKVVLRVPMGDLTVNILNPTTTATITMCMDSYTHQADDTATMDAKDSREAERRQSLEERQRAQASTPLFADICDFVHELDINQYASNLTTTASLDDSSSEDSLASSCTDADEEAYDIPTPGYFTSDQAEGELVREMRLRPALKTRSTPVNKRHNNYSRSSSSLRRARFPLPVCYSSSTSHPRYPYSRPPLLAHAAPRPPLLQTPPTFWATAQPTWPATWAQPRRPLLGCRH